jgi:hypothetical protein
MKKNVSTGVIVAIVVILIAGGVVAWYFLKGSNKTVVAPMTKQTETVTPNPEAPNVSPTGGQSFSDYYGGFTQAQRDCFLQAVGQAKLDALFKDSAAAMQTITGEEYEKLLACPQ